jgi:hypothetical protein
LGNLDHLSFFSDKFVKDVNGTCDGLSSGNVIGNSLVEESVLSISDRSSSAKGKFIISNVLNSNGEISLSSG